MKTPTRLWNRNFLLLWLAQSVSSLGSQGFIIGTQFWIKHATESASLMGLTLMLSSLPSVLLGPIGGTFADRHSRKTVIVLCDAIRGVAVLSLAAVTFSRSGSAEFIVFWIFLISLLTDIVATFFYPAAAAATPDIVPAERVVSANSLAQVSTQLSVFIGQGLGGTLFRLMSAPFLFLINAITYFAASFSELFIVIPQTIPEHPAHPKEQFRAFITDILSGFSYIWNIPGERSLVLVSAILTFFTVPVIVLLPFYVEDILKVSTDWYGFILAAFGIGSLAGYGLAGLIKISPKLRSHLMILFIILEACGYGLLGLVRNPGIAVLLALFGGLMSGFVTVNITTILQIRTEPEIRGRVFGLMGTIASSLGPLAMGLAGVLADLTQKNIPLIYVSSGLISMGLTLVIVSRGNFRSFLVYDRKESVSQPLESRAVSSGN